MPQKTVPVVPLILATALAIVVLLGVAVFRARHGGGEAQADGTGVAARAQNTTAAPAPPPVSAPLVPAPPPPSAPIAKNNEPIPPGRPVRPEASAPLAGEAAIMERLRGLEGSDPPLTLRLAREANARFPDSPDAPERAWMAVKSLVNMQRLSEAHDEAQTMVNRYPGTSWSQDVQRHLLSNPL
jgi:hypothetical protein